jgi:hypothetical protein
MMLEVGIAAKEELLMFFHTNKSLWVMSQVNKKLVLQQENYEDVLGLITSMVITQIHHVTGLKEVLSLILDTPSVFYVC